MFTITPSPPLSLSFLSLFLSLSFSFEMSAAFPFVIVTFTSASRIEQKLGSIKPNAMSRYSVVFILTKIRACERIRWSHAASPFREGMRRDETRQTSVLIHLISRTRKNALRLRFAHPWNLANYTEPLRVIYPSIDELSRFRPETCTDEYVGTGSIIKGLNNNERTLSFLNNIIKQHNFCSHKILPWRVKSDRRTLLSTNFCEITW